MTILCQLIKKTSIKAVIEASDKQKYDIFVETQ